MTDKHTTFATIILITITVNISYHSFIIKLQNLFIILYSYFYEQTSSYPRFSATIYHPLTLICSMNHAVPAFIESDVIAHLGIAILILILWEQDEEAS